MADRLDSKIRELTMRLMQSAPEAPPFPEVTLSHLEPPRRRLRPQWVVATAALAVLVLVGVPMLLLRDGGGTPTGDDVTTSTTTTTAAETTTTTVPPGPATTDVTLYYLAEYVTDPGGVGPFLVPVARTVETVDPADSVATVSAAIEALIAGPTAADSANYPGISSSVPPDTVLLGVSLDPGSGIATLDFDPAVESGGGTFAMGARLAQIVYTATAIDAVDGVVIAIDGAPVDVFSGEGIVLDGPQTRDGYRDLLPLIFPETPLAGATVSSPIRIAGVANTFEASLVYSVETADGIVLADGPATASCGTGCWGDFSIDVDYSLAGRTAGFVVLYESSAQDGRPVNVVRIPVTLEASGAGPEALTVELRGLFNPEYDVQGALLAGGFTTSPTVILDGAVTPGAAVTVTQGRVTSAPDATGAFQAEITLEPGPNVIEVGGTLAGEAASLEVSITYLPDGETAFAFLTRVTATEVVADYAQWLTGDAANQAAFEDGVIGSVDEGVPNDYYIRNVNDLLRTLPLSPDVIVSLPSGRTGPVQDVVVAATEWLALFKPDGSPWDYEAGDEPPVLADDYFGAGTAGFGYWLTLDGTGTVVQVIGQYRP